METRINEVSKSACGSTWVDATCNKTSAWVAIGNHGVQVCTKNAAHKVWRGMGKRFDSKETAIANYKSAEMKAIIETAFAQVQ